MENIFNTLPYLSMGAYCELLNEIICIRQTNIFWDLYFGIWERSGSVVECLTRDQGFEPHRHHCIVSLRKNINPSLVLVQPRTTRPFMVERLLMGRKELKQTNSFFLFSKKVYRLVEIYLILYLIFPWVLIASI